MERARKPWNSGAGKRIVSNPFDVAACLGFDILGFAGDSSPYNNAISLSHVDLLIGTWVRCIFREKDWIVVDPKLIS